MTPYLRSIPQWIVVLLAPLGNGKHNKIPVNWRTAEPCNAHEPGVWTTYDQACAAAAAFGAGFTVGFVLTTNDDLFCLDIDNARQPDGSWSEVARALVAWLPGCMVEVSLSGNGLHVWGRYPSPPPHRKKRIDIGCELYTELRFIAIGTQQTGDIAPRCDALPEVIQRFFPPIEQAGPGAVPEEGPRADWRGPTDDEDLLRRALQSKSMGSVFGAKATFADLWMADEQALARAYPSSNQNDPFDRSAADMALAAHLAFWTGCDVARIERLMRRSKLAREKWDDRTDYLVQRTIMGQCAVQRDVLKDKPVEPINDLGAPTPAPAAPAPLPGPGSPAAEPVRPLPSSPDLKARLVEGSTYLTPAQQVEFFQGCVYVKDQHRVLTPSGDLLTPDKFRAQYGGYSYVMDSQNAKVSRNAWEAFTESQAVRHPRVDGTCFRPREPFGAVLKVAGRTVVNTWIPPVIARKKGDASVFYRHLEKLVPDDYERTLVFYTLCSLAQRVGYKAQWAMVLQGLEGNGKTFVARCVARAIGMQYVYWPRANTIGKDFNAWLAGHVLYVIEELMVHGRQELMDTLKPLITAVDGIEVEKKGVDAVVVEICGNFLANTNHKNALVKTRNDRRWWLIPTAQQNDGDLERDGMAGDYMQRLHAWANDSDGFEIVADVLLSTPIPPEYDFTKGLQRAPRTRSYEEVISASLGPVEQEILEAVEREDVGFKGGWISSMFLEHLLRRMGKEAAVSYNRRREVLQALGYDWHPALREGRVDNPVLPDNQKVKLFVRRDRADLRALRTPAEVAAAYSKAQGVGAR